MSALYEVQRRLRSMVTEERPCTVTPFAYRFPATDIPYRSQTQLLLPSRISGSVPSPRTPYRISFHR